MNNIWEAVVDLHNEGRNGVLITVVDKQGQGPAAVGSKMLIDGQSGIIGTVGGGELESLALKKAREF